MSALIECNSIKGNKIKVPKEKLVFRASAYAVIIQAGKILLLNNKSNNKLFFPGGGIDLGETIIAALKREVKEETGLEIKVQKFLHFKEQFFYYDPEDAAFQLYSFFYLCMPKSSALLADDEVDDIEAEKPRWIEIEQLKNMQNINEVVLEVLRDF